MAPSLNLFFVSEVMSELDRERTSFWEEVLAAENFGGGGLPGTLLGGGGRAGTIFPSTGLKIVQTIREISILISLPPHPRYRVFGKETRFVMTWAIQCVVFETFQEYMNSSDTDWDQMIKSLDRSFDYIFASLLTNSLPAFWEAH